MGVTIIENPHPNKNLSHFTVTLIGNDHSDIHTVSTTLTSNPGVARDWLYSAFNHHRNHRHRLIIGLGVQWTPSHPAATIQLCIGRRCLIFHLHNAEYCPTALRCVLSDPSITFVGLWNHSDAVKLIRSRHELEMRREMPLDLRYDVEGKGGESLKRESIATIANEFLGIDVYRSEEVGRSDWEVEELSLAQVEQATVDAFLSYAIGMRTRAWELNPTTL